MFQDNNAMESHIVKEHSGKLQDETEPSIQTIEKVSKVVSKNMKCDKYNSKNGVKSTYVQNAHTYKDRRYRHLLQLMW